MFNTEDDALNEIADLRRQLDEANSDRVEWMDSYNRCAKQLAEAKEAEKCAYENVDSIIDLLRRDCEKLSKLLAEVTAERDRLFALAYPDGPAGDAAMPCSRYRELEAEIAKLEEMIELQEDQLNDFKIESVKRQMDCGALQRKLAALVEALWDGLAPNALNCMFYPQVDDDTICCCGKPRLSHWKPNAKAAIAAAEGKP